jgi:chaperonin GroES
VEMFPKNKHIAILRADAEKVTAGGIVIPDETQGKNKPQRGYVFGICQSFTDDNGREWKSQFQVGDTVFFAKYVGEEIVLPGGSRLIFMKESEILAGGRDESDTGLAESIQADTFAAAAAPTPAPISATQNDHANGHVAGPPPGRFVSSAPVEHVGFWGRLTGRTSS